MFFKKKNDVFFLFDHFPFFFKINFISPHLTATLGAERRELCASGFTRGLLGIGLGGTVAIALELHGFASKRSGVTCL